MSLMQLLAVGRSIGTIHDQPSRYRMRQQNLLPRFEGAPKVAGLTAAEAGGTPSPTIAEAGGTPSPTIDAGGGAAAASATGISRLELELTRADTGYTPSKFEEAKVEAEPSTGAQQEITPPILEQRKNSAETVSGGLFRKVASPWMGWSLLRNPFHRRTRSGRTGPVQGELGLDMIKPVCNDLNDTDLEIVPRSTEPVFAARAAIPKRRRTLELVGAAWGRLRTGLFRTKPKQT